MTWEELQELASIKIGDLTEEQAVWMALASQLHAHTVMLMLFNFKVADMPDKYTTVDIAQKLSETFDLPNRLDAYAILQGLRNDNR